MRRKLFITHRAKIFLDFAPLRRSRPATVGRKGLHPGGRRGAIGVRLHRPVPVLALVGAPLLLDFLVLSLEILGRGRVRDD
eukprot:scaffold95215_cov58-Phaeocystis_antarctica.AAC.2